MAIKEEVEEMHRRVMGTIRTNHVHDEIVPAMVDAVQHTGLFNVAVEIGSYRGGNLPLYAPTMAPGGLMISIEPEFQVPLALDIVHELIDPQYVNHIRKYSTEPSAYRDIVELLNERAIDFLMIGGDHREPIVRADWEIYHELMGDPGIVMFHDIYDKYLPGPGIIFNELKDKYTTTEYMEKKGRLGIGTIYIGGA